MELKIKGTVLLERTINSKKRIIVHQGGTRSSKTYSIAQFLIKTCLINSGLTVSIVRETLPALKRTAEKDFFDLLKEYRLYKEEYHNKTDRIYLLNRNAVEFFSTDDGNKVRGSKRNILWLNEANEISAEVFRQLLIRTSDRILIDFNPDIDENHWIFEEVISRIDDPDYNDVDYIISTYRDNPFLTKDQIKEIERFKRLDPNFWTVFGEGQRADLQIGTVFNKAYYSEYDILPKDIKSVIYTDPNLAIKEKGDTTAIVHLGYSPSKDLYYVIDGISRSFADSGQLLDEVFLLRTGTTTGIAFDGNVTQESTWTNFVRNWTKIKEIPFPRIDYKRYKVDDLSKNIQLAWNERKILFPAGFRDSVNGKMFLSQLFSFTSKKAKRKDDAADGLICAFEFLHERNLAQKPEGSGTIIVKVNQPINF